MPNCKRTLYYIGAAGLLLCFKTAVSQPHLPEPGASPAEANAVATYKQTLPVEKDIYTGPEHISYLPAIEGFAYFSDKDWLPGSVLYDGILYENQALKYDLVKDKLVLRRLDGFGIELRSDKVGYFTLPERMFVNTGNRKSEAKSGFYEQLAAGALTVLARHAKVLDERAEIEKLRQRFVESTAYYAVKNNTFYAIRNLNDLLSLLDANRGAVQQYLKKSGIRFKRNPELALKTAADYYNKTQR